MKINLDRVGAFRILGFRISLYLAAAILILTVIFWTVPASWLAATFSSQSSCRLMLYEPAGSIWQGSAAIGFSEPDPLAGVCRTPNAITERFQWNVSCKPLQGLCEGSIQFVALAKPLKFQLGFDGLRLDEGEISLPANMLEVLGSPWTTLRPRGEMQAHWTDLDIGHQNSKGLIRIQVSNLSSPISPVKPLGSYDIGIHLVGNAGSWDVATVNGPLLFRGTGVFGDGGLHFSGEVSASLESHESLIGLLSLMGKNAGDIYLVQF